MENLLHQIGASRAHERRIKAVMVVTTKTRGLRLLPPAEPILLLAFLASPQAAKPLHGKHRVRASRLKLTVRIHITAGTQVQNCPKVKRLRTRSKV